jgi:signal transduction protein with GAF and PtsI domain
MDTKERSFFNSFREIVKVVHSTLDVQKVLQATVDMVSEVMHLKACAVRLLLPKKRTLELVASRGLSDKYIRKGSVDADRSIAEAMQGKTVIIEDVRKDPRAQYPQQAADEGIVGMLSVPLTVKGRVIGVMRLYTGEQRSFDEDELNFAEAAADISALAIENARMYESVKKDYESVMNDIHSFVGYRRTI